MMNRMGCGYPRSTWAQMNGPPDRNSAWSSATRMLSSFRMRWNLGGGWYPNVAVVYRKSASWLPQRRIRFDQYVDHLCRTLHGTKSTPRILTVAAAGGRSGRHDDVR